jgi:hypothetical protein
LDAFGAVPAATDETGEDVTPDFNGGQVSGDGSRAFFISPDPSSGNPMSDPVELYMREDGRSSLISKNELSGGTPSPAYEVKRLSTGTAITGISPVERPGRPARSGVNGYVFASATGAAVFFKSMNALAKSAGGEVPSGLGPWTYEYDTATQTITYLPGVNGPILASTDDGSAFTYLEYTYEGEPLARQRELEAGAMSEAGTLRAWVNGRTTKVADVPTPLGLLPSTGQENGFFVAPVRMAQDGSSFVFESNSPIPEAQGTDGEASANNTDGFDQIYRYDAVTAKVVCLSCAPEGGVNTGPSNLSNNDHPDGPEHRVTRGAVVPSRGLTANGEEVFFDSPQALVPQDTNGVRDAYEWDRGHLYLLSSGHSTEPSFFLDSSEDGRDVFFATADGLVAGDTDGGYDVYDAREGGGFATSQPPAECAAECQPASGAPLGSGVPASAAFSGSTDEVPPSPLPKTKSATAIRRAKLAAMLRKCRRERAPRRRRRCERKARLSHATGLNASRTLQAGR